VKKRASFRLRVYCGDIPAIGPGKVALLEAIVANGSIRAAAKELEMSYNRAWLLIHEMNDCFKSPVVESVVGGAKGGGAQVTAIGLQLIDEYRSIERLANSVSQSKIQKLMQLLKN
jgi:molybdate transport system regulatory protein